MKALETVKEELLVANGKEKEMKKAGKADFKITTNFLAMTLKV